MQTARYGIRDPPTREQATTEDKRILLLPERILLLVVAIMEFLRDDARAMQDIVDMKSTPDARGEDENIATGEENMATSGAAENYSMMSEEDYSASDEDLPFEPFDINNDGLIIKTGSRCSRDSWKRPEVGWEVAVTIHRFCELNPLQPAKGGTQDDENEPESPSTPYKTQIEPDLAIWLTLGQDDSEQFPLDTIRKAASAEVELHPLLHDGIETMGRNERATFIVTADDPKTGENGKATPPRRFEYDISLDDWAEEIDLSERKDRSLVKRVVRDGDGSTAPVDIGVVTVRCRVTRTRATDDSSQKGDEKPEDDDIVLVDNLQSQDDPVDQSEDLERPLTFVLDECPFGPGFLAVLKSMTEGEMCNAWLSPVHGPVDRSDDGNFCHHVTIELVEVEQLPPVWGEPDVRVKMSTRFKLEGNDKFVAGDYVRALRRYEKAIRYADGVPPGKASDGEEERNCHPNATHADRPDDVLDTNSEAETNPADATTGSREESMLVDLQVAVLCNQAACHLKMGEGACAVEVAERASKLKAPGDSPAGIKAAYRLACAREAVGDWNEARNAFKRVLDVDANNTQCLQGLTRLNRAEKAYKARLRKTFGGFLVSNKLKGFASEGREELASSRPGNGEGGFGGEGDPMSEDGPWTDDSESETDSGDESKDDDQDTLDEGNGKSGAGDSESPSTADRGSPSTSAGSMPTAAETKPEMEAIEEAALAGEEKSSVQEHEPAEEMEVPGAAPAAKQVSRQAEASVHEHAPTEEVVVPEAAVAAGAAPASEPGAGEGGSCSSSPYLSTGTAVGEGVEEAGAAEPAISKEVQAGMTNVKEYCAIEVGLQEGTNDTPLPTPP